ncbi:hypothetical protein ACJIZ3_018557 [Penstemon smallii]|uniref:Uncharacterized protein n=1 Tax=Penstemon smallii TaxID=265156 RepID=A0ABD3SZ66_9LAMI
MEKVNSCKEGKYHSFSTTRQCSQNESNVHIEDSIVESSSPIIVVSGVCGVTAAVPFRGAETTTWRLLPTMHKTHESITEHTMAGITMDRTMILKICRPRD